jgi:hypothetical protein
MVVRDLTRSADSPDPQFGLDLSRIRTRALPTQSLPLELLAHLVQVQGKP